jgi:hypothetical protein
MKKTEPARGWFRCCGIFYAGYAWTAKQPPCPTCGKQSKQATRKAVDQAAREEEKAADSFEQAFASSSLARLR